MMRPLFRVLAFFEQWGAETVRQPTLMFTLIIAPFLLLLAFGSGVELGGPRPRTVLVQEPGSTQSIEPLLQGLEQHVYIEGIVESLPLARRSLERGEIDAVLVLPEEPQRFIEGGEQVPLQVLIAEVDPVRRSYARAYLRDQVAALNQRTIAEVVGEAQGDLGSMSEITDEARQYVALLEEARTELDRARTQVSELRSALAPLSEAVTSLDNTASRLAIVVPGLQRTSSQTERLRRAVTDLETTVGEIDDRLREADSQDSLPTQAEVDEINRQLDEIDEVAGPLMALDPDVISAPFALQLEDVTPVEPSFTAFYSPGVVALLTQHLAITLGALTLSRIRLLRIIDMLRVAPIRAGEVMLGNYLSYGLLTAITAAGLVALLVGILDVPVLGPWWVVVASVALLILCSLGIGFVISLVASSAQEATQVAMLVLLGSIFFSGFVFSLDRITWPVRVLSYLFPATYTSRTLQDVMLRGLLRRPEDFAILAAAGAGLFIAAWWLMRRELRAR